MSTEVVFQMRSFHGYIYTDTCTTNPFVIFFLRSVGYDFTVFARPELYHIFASRIPRGKILFGKKVLSTMHNSDGVMIRCSDNSSYQGDILVGADGAYSAVRQTLYKQLSRENKLPSCDEEQMSVRNFGKMSFSNELLLPFMKKVLICSVLFSINKIILTIDKLLHHGRDHQRTRSRKIHRFEAHFDLLRTHACQQRLTAQCKQRIRTTPQKKKNPRSYSLLNKVFFFSF